MIVELNVFWMLFITICIMYSIYKLSVRIVVPILDAILYSLGYTIFNILCSDKNKIIKKPMQYTLTIFKWFVLAFLDRLASFGTVEKVTSGNKQWMPYFKYKILDES